MGETVAAAAADEHHDLFVTANDGVRLHARLWGTRARGALPVLCLPGLTRTHRDFVHLARHLTRDPKRPRLVVALDLRGRGRSGRSRDWRHYTVPNEASDVGDVMTALGLEHAVFVGTSRGGLVTMALAAMRPGAIRGVVLNDIGPVIDLQGLARIKTYVVARGEPRDWDEALRLLKTAQSSQFPGLSEEDWAEFLRMTFAEIDGRPVRDYDLAIGRPLGAIRFDRPLPTLWPQFDALARVPVMVLRGEHSDLLSVDTVRRMRQHHPRLETRIVAGMGHAPLLIRTELLAEIEAFIAACEG